MRVKAMLYPIIAVFLGLIGVILRSMELYYGYDGRMLPLNGSVWPVAMELYCLVCLVLLLVLTITLFKPWKKVRSLYADGDPKQSVFYVVLVTLCALIFAAGGLYRYMLADENFFHTPLTILLVLSCTGILANLYVKDTPWRLRVVMGGFSALCAACWLLYLYVQYGLHPTVTYFLYRLLAMVASAAGYYYVTGLSAGKGNARSAIFFCGAAGFLSMIGSAAATTPDQFLFLTNGALQLFLLTRVLCTNPDLISEDTQEEAFEDAPLETYETLEQTVQPSVQRVEPPKPSPMPEKKEPERSEERKTFTVEEILAEYYKDND